MPRPRARSETLAVLLALLAVPAALGAQAGLTPEQLVSLESVGSVAMHPDGDVAAFTRTVPPAADDPRATSSSELHVVALERGALTPIVVEPRSASSPQWSPDGSRLAFLARLDAHDQTQVYAVREGGTPELLTRSPRGVSSFAWSPDGSAVAYLATDPPSEERRLREQAGNDVVVASERYRGNRLWVQPLDADAPRAVTPAGLRVWSFAWAPGGDRIAVQTTENPSIDASYLYRRLQVVPTSGGSPRLFASTEGKLGSMAWSPDGTRLAFVGATSLNDPIAQSVFVTDGGGGEATNLTEGFVGSATWVDWEDASTIRFVAQQGTRTVLNRVAALGGEIELVAGGGAEVFTSVDFDASGERFVASASTSAHPSELYAGTHDGLRRVTRHNEWLADVALGEQETIEWTGPEGWRIEGVLIRPVGARDGVRYPLAILPHGGPEGVSLDGWGSRPLYPAQLLAARGYAVLMPNYRGSAGRGVAFSKGDHRDLGGREFDDVIAGIDHLAGIGLVDPERVGISGTSYGGYFSAWAATRHSDRFKAAIPYAGITNWASFMGTTDIPEEMSVVHFDLWWHEQPGIALDRSPLTHLDEARTPTLIGHGLADERVHPEQSVELYNSLRLMGVPTELVLYPREPHGLTERAHQLDFIGRIVEWLDRYVKAARTTVS